MSRFRQYYNQVHIFEQQGGQDGLYKNQIGAIGSALAHFSTRIEPALIAMPTGTGKTAVMIILSYLLRARKVLVITPSQLVRGQIATQFHDPQMLISKGILPVQEQKTLVYEMTSIVESQSQWQEILSNNDIVVGIPGTVDKVSDFDSVINENAFDLVFIDEAHHSRASSWSNVLKTFSAAKQILLTATPFRRDKKDIKARLIYNYPLKQAYEEGLFSKIIYVPVSTSELNTEEEKNIMIARKAAEVYRNRRHEGHKIIIRTDTRSSANSLFKIYRENTDLNLILVHSNLGEKSIKDRIGKLTGGEVDGVICVDMMGEGFDFPLLKIAAVHIPHKSLAITLQFIGRISRTNTLEGKEATVIAGEHEFRIEAQQLYKKDTKDWSIILPDLHSARVQRTEEEQEFFDSFEDFTTSEPFLSPENEDTISIEDDDLLPFFHAKLYKLTKEVDSNADDQTGLIDITKAIDFSSTNVLSNPVVRHHHVSIEHEVAIHVVSELRKPSWYISTNSLSDIQNQLFVIYFDLPSSILFICSTVKENDLYEDIASQYLQTYVSHEMIPLPFLKRVMAGWEEPKMYNVGMKSRKTKGNSEAYKQILGSLAQNGVLAADKYSYTRGHSFGGGFDPILGKEVIIGVSTSSKVWSLDEKKIKYLVQWFKEIGRKVSDPLMDGLELPLSDLDSGKVVEDFPTEHTPFFADWDGELYHKLTMLCFVDNEGTVVKEALLCSCSVHIIETTTSQIILGIRKAEVECKIVYSINPKLRFNYSDDSLTKIHIKQGSNFSDADKFLTKLILNPIDIFYENLFHLSGKVLFEFKGDLALISSEQIVSYSWPTTVNLQKEFYTTTDITTNSANSDSRHCIHDYIIELARNEFDAVFYDHGSLEIADIIGFREGKIRFYHCKKQDGDGPRCTVDDLYEVNGQAIKSIHWANRRLLLRQICERADKNNSSQKIKKGTLELIEQILKSFDNPILPVEIVIVHPGIKTQNLTTGQTDAFNRIKYLLSAAETYLKDVSSCSLQIMCS